MRQSSGSCWHDYFVKRALLANSRLLTKTSVLEAEVILCLMEVTRV